jgi:uncharacterized SAM-binding protein YcdF (DUF218 family)
MFFYGSKILTTLIWPTSVITLLLVAGALLLAFQSRQRLGKRLVWAGVTLLIVCGLSPLGNIMVLPLEQRFSRPDLPTNVAGIIMLGGFESPGISNARAQLSLNESAERLTEAIGLAHKLPKAGVIFTGGVASLVRSEGGAANSICAYLVTVGITRERIMLEGTSRNTHENAKHLARMLMPKPGQTYLLVTSAYHMPRAVGTFRQQGFEVVPWPVDYRTTGPADATSWFGSIAAGLERVDLAFKEWIGLLAYWATGRSAALWPGPVGRPAAGQRTAG